jgi:putative membrane protein
MDNGLINKDLILREKLALQRTHLANQSTFLSFIRTSLYFLVAGLSVNNILDLKYGKALEILFLTISFSLVTIGMFNYFVQSKKIHNSEIHVGHFKDDYLKDKNG